jgi:hypothetical protein
MRIPLYVAIERNYEHPFIKFVPNKVVQYFEQEEGEEELDGAICESSELPSMGPWFHLEEWDSETELSTEHAYTRIPPEILQTSPLPIQSQSSELQDEASAFVAHIKKAEILGKYDQLEFLKSLFSTVSNVVKLLLRLIAGESLYLRRTEMTIQVYDIGQIDLNFVYFFKFLNTIYLK